VNRTLRAASRSAVLAAAIVALMSSASPAAAKGKTKTAKAAPTASAKAPPAAQPDPAKPGTPPDAASDAPPAAAAPQAPPPLAESLTGMAKAEYGAARILYDDGDFQGALQKLKSAYDLSKDARLLWNMAACEKNLRRYSEVVRLIDRYLTEGAAVVTAEDRTSAAELLETVKAFVSAVSVEVSEPGATIAIDGEKVGTSPLPGPLQVDMGHREIRVSREGFVDFVVTPDLPGGQPFAITAKLVAVKHEGKLRVVAGAKDVIQVDGKAAGTGLYETVLPSGTHVVSVSAPGKRPHQTDVVVQDDDVATLHVTLQDETKTVVVQGGVPTWVWIAGGAVLATGVGVGAYFLFKPSDETQYQAPTQGSWGAISL
jgi:hypothetical protein